MITDDLLMAHDCLPHQVHLAEHLAEAELPQRTWAVAALPAPDEQERCPEQQGNPPAQELERCPEQQQQEWQQQQQQQRQQQRQQPRATAGVAAFPHSCRPRPASEAGDWCPPLDPSSPSLGHEQRPLPSALGARDGAQAATCSFTAGAGARGQGFDWPLHRPRRTTSTVAAHRWRQEHGGGATPPEWPAESQPPATRFWFDPLYIEDPLRTSNNVGRNCFRISAIQIEFQKAYQLCTIHPGATVTQGDFPILGRLCKLLP